MFEHAKKKDLKRDKLFFSFVKKVPFPFKPPNALVTTRGAAGQALMVFVQEKGNNKPRKMCSCYLSGKQGYVTNKHWHSVGG